MYSKQFFLFLSHDHVSRKTFIMKPGECKIREDQWSKDTAPTTWNRQLHFYKQWHVSSIWLPFYFPCKAVFEMKRLSQRRWSGLCCGHKYGVLYCELYQSRWWVWTSTMGLVDSSFLTPRKWPKLDGKYLFKLLLLSPLPKARWHSIRPGGGIAAQGLVSNRRGGC